MTLKITISHDDDGSPYDAQVDMVNANLVHRDGGDVVERACNITPGQSESFYIHSGVFLKISEQERKTPEPAV